MNKNPIRGCAAWGERTYDRKLPETKGSCSRSGGYALKASVSYPGRSHLAPERATRASAEWEVSRGRSSAEQKPGRENPVTLEEFRAVRRAERNGE